MAWLADVTNAGDAAWSRVDVTAELRAPVTSRSALRAALAGADATPLLRRRSVALAPRALAPGERGLAEGAVPLAGLAPAGEPGGVHPLRLRVIADGVEVARLDTAVVRLTSAPAGTLATAFVWPLGHPPLVATGDTEVDGAAEAALGAAIAPDGRLGAAVAALSRADPAVTAAVTLAPAAHLLEDLATLAGGGGVSGSSAGSDGSPVDGVAVAAGDAAAMLATLRALAATARSGPVVTAYAGADLVRLAAAAPPDAGGDEAARAAAAATADAVARAAALAAFEGDRRLLPLLGRASVPVTLLEGGATRRALDLVDGTVLLPHAALDLPDPEADLSLGEPLRRVAAASGRIVPVLVADPFLAEALSGTDRAALAARQGGALAAAQEVLVRSALVFLQAPGRADRGLLLVLPSALDPDPVALDEVLARVGAAPWLELVGPATLAARTGRGGGPRASLRPTEVPPAPRLASALAGADAALRRPVATVAVTDADAPLVLGGRTPAELDNVLLRAAGLASGAAAGGDDVDRALAAIASVRAAADGAVGPVAVAAADLTLTDGAGPLPLSIANGGALPLRVVVQAVGPAGLDWPEGTVRQLVLPAGDDVVLELPVAARGTGTFPVVVRVLDAVGGELAAASLAVRSTAVAGPALAGIVVAVVLMTAVGLVRQRRHGRRPAA